MKLRHRLFEHVLLMLLLALAIFGAAIVLAWMAQWAETLQLPTYLVYGMHLIGMVLFFLDGCVVVAASSTLAARLYQFLSREDI